MRNTHHTNKNTKHSYNDFCYIDGTEETLLSFFKDSVKGFPFLKQKQTQWPLSYHLSPLRANVINWIDFGTEPIEILEIGAGCGAVTEYLASLDNVSRLVSIEGSVKRAEIIKLRCRNIEKLNVVISNVEDYKSDTGFDIVLLIGVLEYAGRYIGGEDPTQLMLNKAAELLKPNGILILAIENQLGYKYLAGINEDHYGIPFEGISGFPDDNGIRTYDQRTLKSLFKKVELSEQKWFYPLPDYKMPTIILSEKSFQITDFNWLDLIDFPTIDPAFPKRPLFYVKEFLKTLAMNDVVSTFMNSFLIIAAKEKVNLIKDLETILAVKTISPRGGKFKKTTYFRLSDNSNIRVFRKLREDNGEEHSEHSQLESERYWEGYNNLFNLIVDAIYHNKHDLAAQYLLKWFNILNRYKIKQNDTSDPSSQFKEFCLGRFEFLPYSDASIYVSGEHIDLIPYNLLLNQDLPHDIKIIDQEWNVNTPIPIHYIVDRGMYYLLIKLKELTKRVPVKPKGSWELPPKLIDLLPSMLTRPDVQSLFYVEGWFQRAVEEGDLSYVFNDNDHNRVRSKIDRFIKTSESISTKRIKIRDRILDFVASMSFIHRLSSSMISRKSNRSRRRTLLRNRVSFSKTVAVIIPVYREKVNEDEEISLKHLKRFLERYDKYFVIPKSLNIRRPGFKTKKFSDEFFEDTFSYNRLMLSKRFYNTFRDYEYILIYQLDSMVFSDELIYWCKQGYDYIGAPWIKGNSLNNPAIYGICGNGGFSLRKVDSFLKVIEYAKHDILKYKKNEDMFWSIEAAKYWHGFKVAPREVGVWFSFELAPRFCFEMTNQTLPFGCHAWSKHDRDFWEPFLLK